MHHIKRERRAQLDESIGDTLVGTGSAKQRAISKRIDTFVQLFHLQASGVVASVALDSIGHVQKNCKKKRCFESK